VVHAAKAADDAATVLAIGTTSVACSGVAYNAIDVPEAAEGAESAGAAATSNTLIALCGLEGNAALSAL
jgi:hypothetical protein